MDPVHLRPEGVEVLKGLVDLRRDGVGVDGTAVDRGGILHHKGGNAVSVGNLHLSGLYGIGGRGEGVAHRLGDGRGYFSLRSMSSG